jgi:MoaA/NifB/PqqE/SkfB family radical SAM enzyme
MAFHPFDPNHHSIEERLVEKATKACIPLGCTFELTPVCNMSCKMCYVRMSRAEAEASGGLLSPADWLDIAEKLRELGTGFLLLSGGEPLLYPGFDTLYEKLHDMGFVLTVNTNGTCLNAQWVRLWKAHRPRRVNITLYGTNADTYEKLCHFAPGYEQTCRGIRLLKDAGIDVKLNVTLTPDNQRELDDFYAFAESMELPIEVDSYVFPLHRDGGEFPSDVRISPELLARATLYTMQQENPNGLRAFLRDAIACREGMQLPGHEGIICRAGRSSCFINWHGQMTPCFALRHAVSLRENDAEKAWKKTAAYVNGLRLSSKCAACKRQALCMSCCGRNECETGSVSGCPDYLCATMDALGL